jgi:hypothetical protein
MDTLFPRRPPAVVQTLIAAGDCVVGIPLPSCFSPTWMQGATLLAAVLKMWVQPALQPWPVALHLSLHIVFKL